MLAGGEIAAVGANAPPQRRLARAFDADAGAEGEAIADSFDESLVRVTAEVEVPVPDDATPVQAIDPDAVVAAESAAPEAIIAPEPAPTTDVDSEPVVLPRHVVTPAQPMPAIKRPHSVAVIVARGADF